MRFIASIAEGPAIREISGHLGEPISTPSLALPRELPVAGQAEREIDRRARTAPDYELDQRVAW